MFKSVKICANWCNLVKFFVNIFKSVQIHAKQCKSVKKNANWCILVQIGANMLKYVQISANQCKLVEISAHLYKFKWVKNSAGN